MNQRELALQLLTLAKGDELAADALLDIPEIPEAIVGFHYQQAVEKLLKALLAEREIDFPRTHDLGDLLDLVQRAGFRLPTTLVDLIALTPFAVELRYEASDSVPGFEPEKSRYLVQQLRTWVETQLITESPQTS